MQWRWRGKDVQVAQEWEFMDRESKDEGNCQVSILKTDGGATGYDKQHKEQRDEVQHSSTPGLLFVWTTTRIIPRAKIQQAAEGKDRNAREMPEKEI